MAIPWLTVLKVVPWAQVISNAPRIADGAKKLWSSVSKQAPGELPQELREARAETLDDASVATMKERLAAVELAADALHDQMLASSELIKKLADQNTQLVERIDAMRGSLAWLTGVVIVLGAIALLSLVLTLAG